MGRLGRALENPSKRVEGKLEGESTVGKGPVAEMEIGL